MDSNEFLDLRNNETINIIENVKKVFEVLDEQVFHSKPSPESWSISECFVHLNLTLKYYIPQMVKITHQKDKYPKEKGSFTHSIIGKLAVKAMTPKPDQRIPFKMKTFAKLNPDFSVGNKHEILHEFLDFQEITVGLCENLKSMSLKKPKIVPFTGPLVKMNVGDALHFMVAHNQRHLLQAENVLKIIT